MLSIVSNTPKDARRGVMIWRNQREDLMTLDCLQRLEIIEFIVNETDRETQGDFEEDMLRDELEQMTDIQVSGMGDYYGWV